MSQRVAVISAYNDAHIPFVEKHLATPLLRIDPQEVAKGAVLSFYFDANKSYVTYKGEDITDLSGIWLRKPQPIVASDLPVPDSYKSYSQSALERLTAQLTTAFPKARWLSDVYAQNRANNKALQLGLAKDSGFNVAPTLFTSDPAAAEAFITEHGECISKPLAVQFPSINGKQTTLMSVLVGRDHMPDLSGLRFAPSIFQKAIDVDIEVRATVVDAKVFAATITSHAPSTSQGSPIKAQIRDSRYGHHAGTIVVAAFELPSVVAKCCIRHCQLLGLPFGAIDLIRDRKGVWWFLENNPNGQWAFVEEATSLPIGKAIANYLVSK
jgi:hypothetical protein